MISPSTVPPRPAAFDSSVSMCIASAKFSLTLITTSPRIAFLPSESTFTLTTSLFFTPHFSAVSGTRWM